MILTGLFNDPNSAEIAYNTLSKRGYTQGEIFYARLRDSDIDARIVIGIRPRNRKDAEYFVNEWDTVYQHPRNSVRENPGNENATLPKGRKESAVKKITGNDTPKMNHFPAMTDLKAKSSIGKRTSRRQQYSLSE